MITNHSEKIIPIAHILNNNGEWLIMTIIKGEVLGKIKF